MMTVSDVLFCKSLQQLSVPDICEIRIQPTVIILGEDNDQKMPTSHDYWLSVNLFQCNKNPLTTILLKNRTEAYLMEVIDFRVFFNPNKSKEQSNVQAVTDRQLPRVWEGRPGLRTVQNAAQPFTPEGCFHDKPLIISVKTDEGSFSLASGDNTFEDPGDSEEVKTSQVTKTHPFLVKPWLRSKWNGKDIKLLLHDWQIHILYVYSLALPLRDLWISSAVMNRLCRS